MNEITVEYINEVIASAPVVKEKIDDLRKEYPGHFFYYPFISIFDVPEDVFSHFLDKNFCEGLSADEYFICAKFKIEQSCESFYLHMNRTDEIFDKYIKRK